MPYLLLGPEIGFGQSAIGRARINGSDSPTFKDDIPDWADQNPGFHAGFGVGLPTKTGQFQFEIRYNGGFSNLYEGPDSIFGESAGTVKTQNFQFTVAHAFGRLRR